MLDARDIDIDLNAKPFQYAKKTVYFLAFGTIWFVDKTFYYNSVAAGYISSKLQTPLSFLWIKVVGDKKSGEDDSRPSESVVSEEKTEGLEVPRPDITGKPDEPESDRPRVKDLAQLSTDESSK